MRRMTIIPAVALAVATASCAANSASAPSAQPEHPPGSEPVRNIILLIADGAGTGMWTAAAYAKPDLAVRRMSVTGLVDTRSGSGKVTDSAAGATVFATGERVTNRTVGVAGTCPLPSPRDTIATAWPAGCDPLESWFDIARDHGKALGIVTTTAVIDATPASFVAHSPSRYWRHYIAEQFVDARLDVLLGGGRRYFSGSARPDHRDLMASLCAGAKCVDTGAELSAYRADDRPLIGLLAPGDFDDADPRPVALTSMVSAALARLERDPDGFVAVFETEATDNATHANLPLDRVTADIVEFDDAVGIALEFARRTPGTLVIATADHETGGFSLVQQGDDFELKYTTGGHTAALVPLFAEGPQAARFGGFRDNTDIGGMLMEIARSW